MKIGDKLKPLIGPYKGYVVTVIEIADPYNKCPWFWITVSLDDGTLIQYTSKEVEGTLE